MTIADLQLELVRLGLRHVTITCSDLTWYARGVVQVADNIAEGARGEGSSLEWALLALVRDRKRRVQLEWQERQMAVRP